MSGKVAFTTMQPSIVSPRMRGHLLSTFRSYEQKVRSSLKFLVSRPETGHGSNQQE